MTLYTYNRKVSQAYNKNRLVDVYRYGQIVNLDLINPILQDKIIHVDRGIQKDTASNVVEIPTTNVDLTSYYNEATKTSTTQYFNNVKNVSRGDSLNIIKYTKDPITQGNWSGGEMVSGARRVTFKITSGILYWYYTENSVLRLYSPSSSEIIYTISYGIADTGASLEQLLSYNANNEDIILQEVMGSGRNSISINKTFSIDIPEGKSIYYIEISFTIFRSSSLALVNFGIPNSNFYLPTTITGNVSETKNIGTPQSGKVYLKVNRDERNNVLNSSSLILGISDTTVPSSNALTSYISLGTFSITTDGHIYRDIIVLKYLQFNPTQDWTSDIDGHTKIGFSVRWILPNWSANMKIVGNDTSDIRSCFGTYTTTNKPAMYVPYGGVTTLNDAPNIFNIESTVTLNPLKDNIQINNYMTRVSLGNGYFGQKWIILRANIGTVRIYEYKLYDISGNLMKHFIPVIKNNQPGFLDKLDASFHTFGMSSVTYKL